MNLTKNYINKLCENFVIAIAVTISCLLWLTMLLLTLPAGMGVSVCMNACACMNEEFCNWAWSISSHVAARIQLQWHFVLCFMFLSHVNLVTCHTHFYKVTPKMQSFISNNSSIIANHHFMAYRAIMQMTHLLQIIFCTVYFIRWMQLGGDW